MNCSAHKLPEFDKPLFTLKRRCKFKSSERDEIDYQNSTARENTEYSSKLS